MQESQLIVGERSGCVASRKAVHRSGIELQNCIHIGGALHRLRYLRQGMVQFRHDVPVKVCISTFACLRLGMVRRLS